MSKLSQALHQWNTSRQKLQLLATRIQGDKDCKYSQTEYKQKRNNDTQGFKEHVDQKEVAMVTNQKT